MGRRYYYKRKSRRQQQDDGYWDGAGDGSEYGAEYEGKTDDAWGVGDWSDWTGEEEQAPESESRRKSKRQRQADYWKTYYGGNPWRGYKKHMRSKRSGYHRNLYRNSDEGMIAGVCAGLADYFGWDKWLVRIIAVTALIFAGSLTFVAYVVAWFMLSSTSKSSSGKRDKKRRKSREATAEHGDSDYPPIFETKYTRKRQLEQALSRFTKLEMRLRRMESYVTSPQFELHQEINRMSRH